MEKNLEEAVKWYRLAADQGYEVAQNNLGVSYEYGDGVEKNLEEAVKWYRLAADQGDADAQNNLGLAYNNGDGVEKDPKEAVKWYGRAAEQGHTQAHFNLAQSYHFGTGVKKNHKKALRLYLAAANSGDPGAQNWVGVFYSGGMGVASDQQQALDWYKKAAQNGDPYGANNLGWHYEKGEGTPVDIAKALKWYKKAAEADNPLALNNLGHLYERGYGVALDYNKAAKYYTDASNLGEVEATIRLALLYENGRGVEKNLQKALELLKKASQPDKDYINSTGSNAEASLAKSHFQRVTAKLAALESKRLLPYSDLTFGNYHALVIGNNNYTHLEKLNTPINDAKVISNLLRTKYGFKVSELLNASRKEIIKSINQYRKTLRPQDNFLLYYAGHGTYDEETKAGYWQPINAEKNDDTEWITNDRITSIVKGLKANNVIVIADSCYSGTVFRGNKSLQTGGEGKKQFLRRIINKKTRVALTSGGNEPVVDAVGGGSHSVFAQSLINILKDNDDVMTSTTLSEKVKKYVIPRIKAYHVEQTPEHSNMYKAGHDGGDFVFVPRALVTQ